MLHSDNNFRRFQRRPDDSGAPPLASPGEIGRFESSAFAPSVRSWRRANTKKAAAASAAALKRTRGNRVFRASILIQSKPIALYLSCSPPEEPSVEYPECGAGLGAAQLGAAGAAAGAGAATGGAAGLGAAGFGAGGLRTGFGAAGAATTGAGAGGAGFAGGFLATAFLADFFGAALDFLADFFADFLAFFADFLPAFLDAFFADFFFAVRTFLFFLFFLPPFFFLPLAIVILLLPPINVYRAFQVVRLQRGPSIRSILGPSIQALDRLSPNREAQSCAPQELTCRRQSEPCIRYCPQQSRPA